MLAGKNPDYYGPKTHRAILRLIYGRLKDRGKAMSLYRIERMVLYFFGSGYGIASKFRKKVNFMVTYLGKFESSSRLTYEAQQRAYHVKVLNRQKTARYAAKKKAREAEDQ